MMISVSENCLLDLICEFVFSVGHFFSILFSETWLQIPGHPHRWVLREVNDRVMRGRKQSSTVKHYVL